MRRIEPRPRAAGITHVRIAALDMHVVA